METKQILVTATIVGILIFLFFYIKNDRKNRKRILEIAAKKKLEKEEQFQKLKTENPEEYQNILSKRKKKLQVEKKKKRIGWLVFFPLIAIAAANNAHPSIYFGIAIVSFIINKSIERD